MADWNFQSDDEEEMEREFILPRYAVLCVVSAAPEMFRAWDGSPDGQKPIIEALKACEVICRSKVISAPKDKVGILFVSTEQSSNPLNCENVFVHQPLSEVTTSIITNLRKMVADPSDMDGFEEKIGSSTECSLTNVFWVAKMLFEEGAKNMNKRIMYFTCDDNPNGDDASAQRDAVKKFGDLGRVDFSVITFNPHFDHSKFYKDIVEEESAIIHPEDSDSLHKVVRMKQRIKRPINRSTLELAPGIKLGVGFYSLIRKAKPPTKVPVNVRTNEPVTKTTTVINEETGLPVLKAEVKKYIEVADERVEFTAGEIKEWKYEPLTAYVDEPNRPASSGVARPALEFRPSAAADARPNALESRPSAGGDAARSNALELRPSTFGEAAARSGAFESGIFLVGFLDKSEFDPFGWFRSAGYFLYPDEERIEGSKELFTSLLRRCDALQKVALVRFVRSRGGEPKLGLLVPSVESTLKFGPTFPQGFHLVVLPFADEIRTHEPEDLTPATPEMVKLMTTVVQKLTQNNFNVMNVQNPQLYLKWKDIENSALNLPQDDEEFEDFTQPNIPLMRKRAGGPTDEFNRLVNTTAGGWGSGDNGAASGGRKPRAPKAPKMAEFNMEVECDNGRLDRLTVAVLKAFCEKQNIQLSRSLYPSHPKAVYVGAIQRFYKNRK